jgi:adenylate cyclase class 2
MPLEIEKKYRLTADQRERVVRQLALVGAEPFGEEFEVNTLFAGGVIDFNRAVLRLRRAGDRATLTFKERKVSDSSIKHQQEDETRVEDADATAAILNQLGYHPALVYEKRRSTWRLGETEVVIDVLPFGLFMEIEGDEDAIADAERLLLLSDLEAEMSTYPQLTMQFGKKNGDMVEARF